ncbi:hypothetical protein BH09BAC3_BH09BAC3_20980 [soil metagenome]
MSHLSLSVILTRILFFLAFLGSFATIAQRQKQPVKVRTGSSIIDDSTKNVYGPATTLWTTERDLFENRPNYRPLDTTIVNYHRWTYVQRFNNFYKDLGPMGTALSPIFLQAPSAIGASSGFQVYEPYYTTEEPHYFDSKSPYTRMYIVWGGNGRAMTRVEFSRNINPRWNFGFNYRPILVEKQIQRRQKGDYQTVSHYYDFYTTYKSKDSSYFLLLNFRRIRHRVKENGGVFNPSNEIEGLSDDNAVPNLTAAETEDYRRNIHLFHQYQIVQAFQLYHIADFTRQSNGFKDVPSTDSNDLFGNTFSKPYDAIRTDSINLSDESVLETMQQEIGIKGNASKFFYSAYYKFRTYDYSNKFMQGDYKPLAQTSGTESYVGGTISLKLDSVSQFRGSAETNFLEGFYSIAGEIQTPWIEGSFRNTLSKPGFMQQAYRGAHDYWNKTFDKVAATEAKGFLKWKQGSVQVWAGGTFTLLNNYIYFKEVPSDSARVVVQSVDPTQYSGTLSTISPEIRASFRFLRHVHLRPQFIFTEITSNFEGALRIPKQFVNIQLAYENSLFKDHLQLHTGIDFHWQSSYYALAYTPTVQQFYVPAKDIYPNPEYPLVDIFLVGKMRRARFFVKYHNVAQVLLGRGYSPTPGYPGQKSILDFGFDFLLFD